MLLLAMPTVSQAKADFKQCLVNHFNTSLQASQAKPIKTWDERYPGNEIGQILDRMLLGKTSRESGNQEVLDKMAESFKARGIEFRRDTTSEGHESLIILPVDRASDPNANSLNRLAAGILKYDPSFELRYTPELISESYTYGIYARQGSDGLTGHRFIEIGHAAAIEGSAKDQVLVHEVIHAKHKGDERRGKIHPYSIEASAIDAKGFLKKRAGAFPSGGGNAYDSYFKFDELITFRHNLWASARGFTEAIRKRQDSSISRTKLNTAIEGLSNISKQSWASADIAGTALKELETAKKLQWDKSVKFERNEINYKGSTHFYKDKEGKPYVIIKIEELPGLLSRREVVTSFALKIPLKADFAPESGIPAEIIHQNIDDIRKASKQTFGQARDAQLTLDKLEKSDQLTALEKASLLQQLEKVTKRDTLPGYSPK